jgi:hypothetical protein
MLAECFPCNPEFSWVSYSQLLLPNVRFCSACDPWYVEKINLDFFRFPMFTFAYLYLRWTKIFLYTILLGLLGYVYACNSFFKVMVCSPIWVSATILSCSIFEQKDQYDLFLLLLHFKIFLLQANDVSEWLTISVYVFFNVHQPQWSCGFHRYE